MRPRRIAAENTLVNGPTIAGEVASMRPRRIAAENATGPFLNRLGCPGFNEAAANRRGKPGKAGGMWAASQRFNEAAANRRGKQLRRGPYQEYLARLQ